jgi:hypothetical protein
VSWDRVPIKIFSDAVITACNTVKTNVLGSRDFIYNTIFSDGPMIRLGARKIDKKMLTVQETFPQ